MLDFDLRVEFGAHDLAQVRAFVEEIKRVKPNKRRTQLSATDRDSFEVAGKLGEVAFGRCFGYAVDWSVHAGGDGYDFLLWDGTTVDVKAIAVEHNMEHDFAIPIGPNESFATYFVQVLIAPQCEYGVITGGISRKKFFMQAATESGWRHRGEVEPFVVKRSQLSQDYPPAFWLYPEAFASYSRLYQGHVAAAVDY